MHLHDEFYVQNAAALGIRLGVPKPGIRMAPPELLESILGVRASWQIRSDAGGMSHVHCSMLPALHEFPDL